MTEPARADAPAQGDGEPLQAALAALRAAGAERLDPLRFHYAEALSRRLQAAPAGLRPVLEAKLAAALAELSARQPEPARAPRRPAAQAAAGPATCAPLAELNRYIRSRAQDTPQDGLAGGLASDGEAGSEMKSLRRFRETWSRIAAEAQVDQALVRGPENAGPLNSHMLVLRSLALMRQISPDYLRRFLAQLDALLWLDQANQQHAPAEARPARRRQRK